MKQDVTEIVHEFAVGSDVVHSVLLGGITVQDTVHFGAGPEGDVVTVDKVDGGRDGPVVEYFTETNEAARSRRRNRRKVVLPTLELIVAAECVLEAGELVRWSVASNEIKRFEGDVA